MKNITDPAPPVTQAPDPLYLFACRVRCLRFDDPRAYEDLLRAANHSNPDVRTTAEVFLDEIHAIQPRVLSMTEVVWAG